ncbi:aryl-alcohol oxidase 3 [Ancistrocladus abbreviatus]
MEERENEVGNLVFAVNGERFELPSIDPSTTLLEFLRSNTRFKSVKLGCGEGGCGACIVLLSKYDPLHERVEDYSVSSCLTLLCSVNGCSITTTEGLGNSKDGFHPIQQRFAGFHASQCGFCTPGMCVSLFSALVNAEKTDRPVPAPGFSKLTVSEAEKAVSGNLCRCTGYRAITDVCKSFAADVDVEDLGFNAFWQKEESKDIKISSLPFYDRKNEICTFPEFLKKEIKSGRLLDSKRYSWCCPGSIAELQSLLRYCEGENGIRIKLVVSNTGSGYYKETEKYDKYIDLRYIPEMSVIKRDPTGIQIGAGVAITKAIESLREGSFDMFDGGSSMIFKKIADHLEKIASDFIRNSASVGGNLVMAQKNQFPSDIVTVLLAVNATVDLIIAARCETITLEELLERPPLDPKAVLVSINIPSWKPSCDSSSRMDRKLMFETYRAAPRPLGNALPFLNAAFLAEISPCQSSRGITVNNIQLAFGAYGCRHAIRVRNAEEFLTGRTLDYDVLYETIKLVQATVVPQDGVSNQSYRSSLAVAYLFEFLHPLIQSSPEHSSISLNGCTESLSSLVSKVYDKSCHFDAFNHHSPLLASKQVIGSSKEYHPVGVPIIKTGAAMQASGEAVFVDDIPSPTNCLHGAFIYSTKPLARVNDIRLKSESLPDGVMAIISFKDIPKGGENIGANLMSTEPLFADDLTRCAGDRIALVVADTQKHADVAANLAVVDYDTGQLEAPILTVEEAVERSSFFDVPPMFRPKPVGDLSKGMAEADHKIMSAKISLPSQYCFYMETQTALAVPDEDNCMVVYSSNQCPEATHSTIARCLGVPEHNVRIITRRVGGGFGGKGMKALPVATACALAAYKLQRPVRMYLNRKTDMIMAGGRHPMKIAYSVGFKSDGKITALDLVVLINAGMAEDFSPVMPFMIAAALKKYDWGALSFDMKVCKTNHTSKSMMRGPGEVQGSFIAEAVIEHVASSLSMEVDVVRMRNLHTYNSLSIFYGHSAGEPEEYTLPSIWDKLTESSGFYRRNEMVREFNNSHKWQKRGISRVPIVIEVSLRPTPGKVSILQDGSIAVEIGGIEIGQGLWTKVKQMAAFALGLIQCVDTEVLLDKVRVIQTDTLSLTQGGITGASTTSESSCEAVRISCNILVERLTPLKERLQKEMGHVKWETLILQAYAEAVNLSASSYYVPDSTSMHYLNYGAAVSEVEVNLLTGETTVLQTDILYDCGQSLNPAVDLGQIEGAFVQGMGFFMLEEYLSNSDGLMVANGTWTYKIPTVDTIPRVFNVEVINSGHHKHCVLSSKASGEPPLLLASSVHCATRAAIKEARKQLLSWSSTEMFNSTFQLDVPATMPVVKELCGLDMVERYLKHSLINQQKCE